MSVTTDLRKQWLESRRDVLTKLQNYEGQVLRQYLGVGHNNFSKGYVIQHMLDLIRDLKQIVIDERSKLLAEEGA